MANPINLKKAAAPILFIGIVTAGFLGWTFTKSDNSTVFIPFPESGVPPVDAPPDSAIDAVDAPAGTIDPTVPWVMNTIISHNDCKGADGTNTVTVLGQPWITTACEQGNKIYVAKRTSCGVFSVTALPSPAAGAGSVIGPEDSRFGDTDGDGDFDVVTAESGGAKIREYKNNGTGFDVPTTVTTGTIRYMHAAVFAPDVIFAGSYSTGAEVARFNRSGGVWTKTTLTPADWVKGLEIHNGDDLLIWDYSGNRRGVRWIRDASVGTGTPEDPLECTITPPSTACLGPNFTLRGAKVGADIAYAVGSSDGLSSGTKFAIIGGATATYPTNFGRAQAVNLCDIDGDATNDMVITASHADAVGESSVLWLKGPSFTQRGEVSGEIGIKHDNAVCMDVDCDGDLDIVTTEEKSLGLIWYENPRLNSFHWLSLLLLVIFCRKRWRIA